MIDCYLYVHNFRAGLLVSDNQLGDLSLEKTVSPTLSITQLPTYSSSSRSGPCKISLYCVSMSVGAGSVQAAVQNCGGEASLSFSRRQCWQISCFSDTDGFSAPSSMMFTEP